MSRSDEELSLNPDNLSAGQEEFDSRELENFHGVSFYAVLAGSTSLIPLPFVDDWAHSYVRRRMIRGLCRLEPLSRVQESLLVNRAKSLRARRGCVGQALVIGVVTPLRLVVYVAGRLFKKIFFVLAIKEATDRAAEAFQEGYLISVSQLICSLEPTPGLDRDQKVLQLSYALEETMREVSASPLRRLIRKVFRGSYGLLFRAASRFREIRNQLGEQEPGQDSTRDQDFLEREEKELEELVENLEAALPVERRYLDSVATRFKVFARRRGLVGF